MNEFEKQHTIGDNPISLLIEQTKQKKKSN